MKSVDEFHVNYEIETAEWIRNQQIITKNYFAAMEIWKYCMEEFINMKTSLVPRRNV